MKELKDTAAQVVVAHERLHLLVTSSPKGDFPAWLRAIAIQKEAIADAYDALHRVLHATEPDVDVRKALGIALSDAALWRRDWAYKDEAAANRAEATR